MNRLPDETEMLGNVSEVTVSFITTKPNHENKVPSMAQIHFLKLTIIGAAV
jgi:hypothetical protein